MVKKGGQIQSSHIMVVIIAIFVAALSLLLGYKWISGIGEGGCEAELMIIESDLKASADAIFSQTGSVESKEYGVPCGVEEVYFIDLNVDGDIVNEQKVIHDSVSSGVKKNVFFMKDGKIRDSIYVPSLKLKDPYYRCFDMRRRAIMEFYLEGYEGGTNIIHIDNSTKCG